MGTTRVLAILLAAAALLTSASSAAAQAPAAPDIALPPGDAARGKAIFEGSKGNCQSCHRVSGVGSLFAPDLTTIGAPPRGGGGGGRGGGAAPAAAAAAPAAGAAAAAGAGRGRGGGFGGDEVANAAIAGAVPPVPGGRGGQGGGPTPQQLAQSILDPNAVVAAANRYITLKMKDGKTITGKLLSVDTFAYQIFDSSQKPANISKENVREATMASPMPSYRDKLSTQELSDVVSYLISLKGQ